MSVTNPFEGSDGRPFVFESARRFTLISYHTSHGPLLLRSGKGAAHPMRLDILIKDVRVMEIRSWFDGIRIEEVEQDYLHGQPSNPAEMIHVGNKVYAFHGAGWRGFVVGGSISVREDDREFMDPSPFSALHWFDVRNVRDSEHRNASLA